MNKPITSFVAFFFLVFTACSNTSEPKEKVSDAPVDELMEVLSEESPVFNPDTFRYDLQYVMGEFEPAKHPDFVQVDPQYSNTSGRYLHKDTYAAFQRMYEAALADGIKLTIVSAARSFNYQKGLWENKWTGQNKIEGGKDASKAFPDPKTRALKILKYSAMPGSSRHHWGTDVDLIDFNNAYFESGVGKKAYDWLLANAAAYGFCQPYTAGRPYGYLEERWHWSFLPLAQPLTALARLQLKDEMLSGFAGAEVAAEIGVLEKYILGINLECLPE